MNPVLRSVLAVLSGAVVGGIVVFLIEMVGYVVYPPPSGIDWNDRAAVNEVMANAPAGVFLFLLLAWGVGTFAGAWLAARVAGRAPLVHALIVGGLFLAAGVLNLVTISHPAWFWVAGIIVFPVAAYLAGSLVRTRKV